MYKSVCVWLHNTQHQLFYGRDYPGEAVPEETPTHHPDHYPVFFNFFRLWRSIASSLFKLHASQSFCTTSLHILFCLPLGLEPSTSYSIHSFTQSVSSLRNTCPYHRNLFCCIVSRLYYLFLISLLAFYLDFIFYLNITHLSDHSHLCSLKCYLVFFHDRPGLASI